VVVPNDLMQGCEIPIFLGRQPWGCKKWKGFLLPGIFGILNNT